MRCRSRPTRWGLEEQVDVHEGQIPESQVKELSDSA